MFLAAYLVAGVVFGGSALAAVASEVGLFKPGDCYRGESTAPLCYIAPNNTPQQVSVDDVKLAANYLGSYGSQAKAGRLLAMNAADTPNCGEWSLYVHNTVQITAKHLGVSTNPSVFYKDVATTIDGGFNATGDQVAASLLGCGSNGGSQGVLGNSTNPAYNTTAYKKLSATPGRILIKVVASVN